jgi:hypothetical protein
MVVVSYHSPCLNVSLTNRYVHSVCSRRNDGSNYERDLANDSNFLTTEQI